MGNPSVAELLAEGRATGLDPVDVRVLACAALGVKAAWLRTHDRDVAGTEAAVKLRAWFSRRAAGEPVAYLTGHREFYGLDLAVAPGVLIPRPDTELLVELALERLPGSSSPFKGEVGREMGLPRVLDLGTGSGAIALAIKAQCPAAEVTAVDVSPEALAIARANGGRLGLPVRWREGAWFGPVKGETFDLIVSNPPYIVPGDPHLSQGDLRFEPTGALVGAGDGLDDIRAIVTAAPAHLAPGGWLLFEHGFDQAPACRGILAAAGFTDVQSWTDLAGIERSSGGRRG